MIETRERFLERRPQRLCLMCGKCCRIATSSIPYDEMVKRAEEGDKEAVEFLEIFRPLESIEEAKKLDKEIVENIPDYEHRTFYTCRFLKDNLCTRYETRYGVCKRFPSSPWAVVPPGCGFEGWLFVEREKIMKYVRGLKEEQLKYKMMLQTTPELKEKLEKLITSIDENIKLFAKYGSEKW